MRLDKYLWAIRVFKTRTQAADAINKGKVQINNVIVKASKQVAVSEVYEIKTKARHWKVEVTGIPQQRVAYREAVKYYKDLSPPQEDLPGKLPSVFVEFTGKRMSKQGRPTKRDRRKLNNLL